MLDILKDSPISFFWTVAVKYRDVLWQIPVWRYDTLLGVMWVRLFSEKFVSDDECCMVGESGMAVSDEESERRVTLLLAELRHVYSRLEDEGYSYDDVRRLLWDVEKVSRVIVEDCSVVLPDLDVKIGLTPLQMTIYRLFLNHPEGIRVKDVVDYKDELLGSFVGKVRNTSHAERIISRLCDPTSGAFNENVSRIKGAFIRCIGEECMARHYFINGSRDERYLIPLNRELVSW